jgi:hypothetical protein
VRKVFTEANIRERPGFRRPIAYATPSEHILPTCTALRAAERLLRQRRRQHPVATTDCQGGGDSDPGKDFDRCDSGKSRRQCPAGLRINCQRNGQPYVGKLGRDLRARSGWKPRAGVTTPGGRESSRRLRGTGLQRGNRGGLRRTVGRRGRGYCRRRNCNLGRKHAQRQPDRKGFIKPTPRPRCAPRNRSRACH